MRFRHETEIYSADGHSVGRIDRIVLDPDTREVTHLIARKGVLLTKDRIVPLSIVAAQSAGRVDLAISGGEVDNLPEFEERKYVPADENAWPASGLSGAPEPAPTNFYIHGADLMGNPIPPVLPAARVEPVRAEVSRNIPENKVALKTGARVLDSDRHDVGQVEQILTAPGTELISHLVISKGLLLKTRKLVSAQWIQLMNDDEVLLSVPADRVQTFPDYETADG
jgi:sporulation protein YlmC with PRC-barrel domain